MADRVIVPRVGIGYDVHQLVEGRPLILGGVHIPHTHGLLGHSDADVLTHSIMDAMLGALALGSIGDFFPDTDPKYKDADSIQLCEHVVQRIRDEGYELVNVDSVIVAQAPKLSPHVPAMQQRLSDCLGIEANRIGIKATTSETLGFEGRREGISTQAVVMLREMSV